MHWTTWLAVSGLTASISLAVTGFAVVEHARAPMDAPSAPLAGLHQLSSAAPPAPPIYNNASPSISAANGPSCDKPGAMGLSRIIEITAIGGPRLRGGGAFRRTGSASRQGSRFDV